MSCKTLGDGIAVNRKGLENLPTVVADILRAGKSVQYNVPCGGKANRTKGWLVTRHDSETVDVVYRVWNIGDTDTIPFETRDNIGVNQSTTTRIYDFSHETKGWFSDALRADFVLWHFKVTDALLLLSVPEMRLFLAQDPAILEALSKHYNHTLTPRKGNDAYFERPDGKKVRKILYATEYVLIPRSLLREARSIVLWETPPKQGKLWDSY